MITERGKLLNSAMVSISVNRIMLVGRRFTTECQLFSVKGKAEAAATAIAKLGAESRWIEV